MSLRTMLIIFFSVIYIPYIKNIFEQFYFTNAQSLNYMYWNRSLGLSILLLYLHLYVSFFFSVVFFHDYFTVHLSTSLSQISNVYVVLLFTFLLPSRRQRWLLVYSSFAHFFMSIFVSDVPLLRILEDSFSTIP